MKHLITAAAVVAALLTVLSTRLLIPAFILVYRYIEQSFAPEEPVTVKALPMSTAPVAVVSEPIEQRQAQSANQRFPSLVTWIAEIHCSTTLLLLGD